MTGVIPFDYTRGQYERLALPPTRSRPLQVETIPRPRNDSASVLRLRYGALNIAQSVSSKDYKLLGGKGKHLVYRDGHYITFALNWSSHLRQGQAYWLFTPFQV